MTIDLNIPPYYDDFDPEKGYYKFIFRPRTAAQAREMTGLQSMLQNQIKRFGQHVFQEGSVVLGGAFDLEVDIHYVKGVVPVNILDPVTSFTNKIIVGGVSGVKAYVRTVEYDSDTNQYVFFIRYVTGSATDDLFQDSEPVQVEGDPTLTFTTPTSSTGKGSIFSISDGVVFRNGYFVEFPYQTVVLSKYSVTPSASIGFKTVHRIITETEDPSLVDNALGYKNKNAPGAHRLQIDAVLTVLDYGGGGDDPEFTELMKIKSGIVESREERTQYARIYDELAKRTYDESGDYYVSGLNVITREHLDTGSNEGLLFANNGGDANLISIEVAPGTAYVKGYEQNLLTTRHIVTDKSSTYNFVNESFVNATTGGYLVIKEVVGHPILDVGTQINLYSTAETRITSKINVGTAPGGSILGTARVKAVVYNSGTLGQAAATLRIYLYDVVMTAGLFSNAKAVGISGSFFGDIVLNAYNKAVLEENNQNVLVFPLGSEFTRSLRDEGGQCETSFTFYRTDDSKTIEFSPNTGTYSVVSVVTGEEIPYSGTLSAAQKRELLLSVKALKDFELAGTVSNTTASTIVGTGTAFTNLNVGDRIKANNNLYFVNSISNATQLTVVGTLATALSGNRIYRSYLAGDIIDLTVKGSSGATRTATCTAGTLTIDVKEDVTSNATLADGTLAARLTYPVRRAGATAAEIEKTLLDNRYVKINCTGYNANQLTQPINLGIPDVYKIRSIRKHTSTFTTGNEGTDVTSQFIFDNGQRDNHYDHAKIRGPIANTDYLLIKLDHFDSSFASGVGYFSIDSYPIDDSAESNTTIFTYQIPKYPSTSGQTLDLRNCLDFRPYAANTANSSTTVAGATSNPANATLLKQDAAGLRIPVPDSIIGLDYSYYLARRDIVVMDISGNINVIKGQAAISPISPPISENVMALANIYISPYPSITEKLARIISETSNFCITKKLSNVRYTMREIGVLKQRIDTLDYYNALNLLEKRAADLKIIDPTTGLDRFKNGFFVDGFIDHSLGATDKSDYKIAVDRVEQSIRPIFTMDSFRYRHETTGSTGIQKTGPLLTLPYTEVSLLSQNNVTTTRNIEQSVYRFIGTIEATPENDIWTDSKTTNKTIDFGSDLPPDQVMFTEWGSWSTYMTGYNVYLRSKRDTSGVINPRSYYGSFSSYADAYRASRVHDGTYKLIESSEYQERTGIQTVVGYENQTEQLGNFVTDTSLINYIRPQIIQVYARGLKPNTRYYTYFDTENMSDYVTPMVIPDTGIEDATQYLAEGASWRTDEYGELLGFLRLPVTGKRFVVGTKEIMITDSPTNAIDATSYAQYYWTALGLNVQKQNTILSTVVPVVKTNTVKETREKERVDVIQPSCMAYSFKIDVPKSEEGIFLTSVDVFISAMHPTLGVWFEIREMDAGGGITRNQVPYSEVWMKRDDPRIHISDDPDALVATNVNFPAPVFLYNDTQYAFVIHTEGLNPHTYFWVSRLGETDVRTGKQVTSRKLTGTLFTTNNNLNYDMVPDVDLLIQFKRANFTVGSGTAILGNVPTEFAVVSSVTGNLIREGERILGSEKLTLSNVVGANGIIVGDKLLGANSAVTANVIAITGSNYFTDYWGFKTNEGITVKFANNTNKGVTANVATIVSGNGTMRTYDSNTGVITIDNSNGGYFANCAIKGVLSNDTARITSFTNYPYSTIELKPHFLSFNRTSLEFNKRGYRNDLLAMGDYYAGLPDATSYYDDEHVILSRATEITALSSNSSSQIQSIFSTQTPYLSPVIDLNRANSIYVHNLINNDFTNEANTASGGNALNKYISKTITLDDGQDAEDMIVKVSAYRPPNSTIKMYYKIRNDEDGDLFDQKTWVELDYTEVYSSKANRNNFIEMEFSVPAAQKSSGVIQYTANGNTFLGFKQFAVKIVLLGTNSALVPRVADLQVICVQS